MLSLAIKYLIMFLFSLPLAVDVYVGHTVTLLGIGFFALGFWFIYQIMLIEDQAEDIKKLLEKLKR